MFRSLKNSLNSFFETEKVKNFYTSGVVINLWEEVVGKSIKKNTQVVSFKKNTLIIKTSNPVWKNELLFQKTELLNKLNTKQPKMLIKDIKFI